MHNGLAHSVPIVVAIVKTFYLVRMQIQTVTSFHQNHVPEIRLKDGQGRIVDSFVTCVPVLRKIRRLQDLQELQD